MEDKGKHVTKNYLLEKHIDCQEHCHERLFFKSYNEAIKYLENKKENIFNNGFTRNEIRIIELRTEEEQ